MNTNNSNEKLYGIWLSQCKKVGYTRAKLLAEYFGSAEQVYKAGRNELSDIEGMSAKVINDLCNKDLSNAEKILTDCDKIRCTVLSITDKEYPDRLRNIYDPPTVLYVKGKLPPVDTLPVIGVVGTRHCTPYGYTNAEKICRRMSQAGIVISTGMAKGIDTAAAIGGLQGSMPVIGVIACGVDKVYPPSNRKLFEKVISNGAIVSEYIPGTEALPAFFPMRNRIISGLSLGVAVIEAPEKSGALITVNRAAEQCRDVFALPGNVDSPTCVGSNRLLRDGAIPFMTADDIIDEYKDLYETIKKPIDNKASVDYIDLEQITVGLSDNEAKIVKTIGFGALYMDEIIANSGVAAHTALASLTGLEIGGLVKRNNTGKWEIVN